MSCWNRVAILMFVVFTWECTELTAQELEQVVYEYEKEKARSSLKGEAWVIEQERRAHENEELARHKATAAIDLELTGMETRREVDAFKKAQEQHFENLKEELEAKQAARWNKAERDIDEAVNSRDPARAQSRNENAEFERSVEKNQADHIENRRAEEEKYRQDDLRRKEEQRAWAEESALRTREDEALRQTLQYAREAMQNRFANDPDKLLELTQKQDEVFRQQMESQARVQQERWEQRLREMEYELAKDREQQRRLHEREDRERSGRDSYSL